MINYILKLDIKNKEITKINEIIGTMLPPAHNNIRIKILRIIKRKRHYLKHETEGNCLDNAIIENFFDLLKRIILLKKI